MYVRLSSTSCAPKCDTCKQLLRLILQLLNAKDENGVFASLNTFVCVYFVQDAQLITFSLANITHEELLNDFDCL